jgi:hypothetical protein
VAGDGSVDSMFQFLLERRCDGMKRCQKMKRRQRAYLDSIERKCDTTRRRDNVGQRRGGTGERKGVGRCELGCRKMKKIYVVNSVVINRRWRFKTIMS